MSTAAAPTAFASPADGVAALAAQADARLQQLLQQMLAQSQLAGDTTAALSLSIQQRQAASLASVNAASYRVFEIADQHRRIALREVPQLNDLAPLDPQPRSFAAAIAQVNAWCRDPLLAQPHTPEETADSIPADCRIVNARPPLPESSPPVPGNDSTPSH